MSVQSINTEIITSTFTNDELSSIIDAVKFARARLGQQTKRTMTIGSTVKFTNSRTGIVMQGTVRKIAIKNVVVDTAQGGWKVPAAMLEVV